MVIVYVKWHVIMDQLLFSCQIRWGRFNYSSGKCFINIGSSKSLPLEWGDCNFGKRKNDF